MIIIRVFVLSLSFCVWSFGDINLARKSVDLVFENSAKNGFNLGDVFIYNSQVHSGDQNVAGLGVMCFVVLGDVKTIEIAWWRSENSSIREICVAMLLLDARGGVKADSIRRLLKKSSERFKQDESEKRVAEIEKAVESLTEYRLLWEKVTNIERKKND
ncbi:MAG: hypothetical protein ACI9NQ_000366 [Paracoccaceae bacterium]|jgi:hypothetical protein